MELALNFGVPAERLAREMTEREFRQWGKYARDHVLPSRRGEMYQAQIAWAIAYFMGGNAEATIDDYMFGFSVRHDEPKPDVDAAKAAFNFSPRKKKASA